MYENDIFESIQKFGEPWMSAISKFGELTSSRTPFLWTEQLRARKTSTYSSSLPCAIGKMTYNDHAWMYEGFARFNQGAPLQPWCKLF